jgi:hypothetical protein
MYDKAKIQKAIQEERVLLAQNFIDPEHSERHLSQIKSLEAVLAFVEMLENGTWDEGHKAPNTPFYVKYSEISLTLISDAELHYCGIVIKGGEVFLFGITKVGPYYLALKYSMRGGRPHLFISADQSSNSPSHLINYHLAECDNECRLVPYIPLKSMSFIELYNFVRSSLDNLPNPLRDGFIDLTDENIAYLDTLKFK